MVFLQLLLIIVLTVFSVIWILASINFVLSLGKDIGPLASSKWHRRSLNEYLKRKVGDKELKVCELGAGWGGVYNNIKHLNIEYTGVEVNKFLSWLLRMKKIKVINDYAENIDFNEYDYLIVYMTVDFNKRLYKKLKEADYKGEVISFQFDMEGNEIYKVEKPFYKLTVYKV